MIQTALGSLWQLVRRYVLTPRLVLQTVLLILLVASADLFCPYLAMRALNVLPDALAVPAHAQGAFRAIVRFAGFILALAVLQYVARYWLWRMQNRAIFNASARLRADLYACLQSERAVTSSSRRVGDVLSRLVADVQTMQDAVVELIASLPYDLTRVIGVLIMMFILKISIGATVCCFLLAAGIGSLVLARRGWRSESRRLNQLGSLNAQYQESLSSGKTLQAMNAMPGESRALDRAADVYAQVQESGSRVQSAVSPFFGLTEYAGLVVVLVVGGWFTLHGTLTIGAMVAFLAYMEILAEPLTRLGATIPALQTSAAAVDRISGVLNQQEPELAAGTSDALSYAVLHGAVQLQDVSFSYTRGGSDSLHGISFCIQPGSRIALIGRNGAGKSTLLELLLKLHTPTSGTISVGGQDLQQLDTRAWRTHVGVMPQEVVVLNRSIAANISLGLGGEVDVRTAARRAGLEDAILALPQQYHTVIGERGVLLSGGMRQRLAIARLLARNPGILLLDEPTSALDLEAEAELLPVINNLCQGRTTIIISHRVALLTDVDSVLLLDAGRLVAHKTPGQAWEAHPDFHDLFPPAWSLCARRG